MFKKTMFLLFLLFSSTLSFSEPYHSVSNEYISSFSRHAIETIYTYSYKDYTYIIDANAKMYFTEKGRISFIQALNESGNLQSIVKNKLMVDSIVVGDFEITSIDKNKWKVDTMVRVSYSSRDKVTLFSNGYHATLILIKKLHHDKNKVIKNDLKIDSFFIF